MPHKLDFKEEHIVLVTRWWADRLRGKDSDQELVDSSIYTVKSEDLRKKMLPDEEKIAKFELELANLLRTTITPKPFGERPPPELWGVVTTRYVVLHVEYQAWGLLRTAAKAAGVNDMAFPWKTRLEMCDNFATIQDGYAPTKYLYDEREKKDAE
jgi:hypothetical protein